MSGPSVETGRPGLAFVLICQRPEGRNERDPKARVGAVGPQALQALLGVLLVEPREWDRLPPALDASSTSASPINYYEKRSGLRCLSPWASIWLKPDTRFTTQSGRSYRRLRSALTVWVRLHSTSRRCRSPGLPTAIFNSTSVGPNFSACWS